MAESITRTAPADDEEDAAVAPVPETEVVEESGGLAGYVMGAPGAVIPVSSLDDPDYSASDSPLTSYTPAASEESSAPS